MVTCQSHLNWARREQTRLVSFGAHDGSSLTAASCGHLNRLQGCRCQTALMLPDMPATCRSALAHPRCSLRWRSTDTSIYTTSTTRRRVSALLSLSQGQQLDNQLGPSIE